ncbi:hypothetical protein RUM44_004485 [Polyplax serrata]|uniref:Uncharacterized protein n=1 Tax=Polyplax serrata TaxID=468196 RepID=A0ABR1B309_POLSC
MSLDPACNKPIFQTSLSLSTDAPISHRKAQVDYFTLLKNKIHFDVALQDEQGKLSGEKKQLSPFIYTNYRPGLPNKAHYEFFELGFFVWKLHRVPDTGPEHWALDK